MPFARPARAMDGYAYGRRPAADLHELLNSIASSSEHDNLISHGPTITDQLLLGASGPAEETGAVGQRARVRKVLRKVCLG